MNTKTPHEKDFSLFVLCAVSVLLAIFFPTNSTARGQPPVDGEMAVCKVTTGNKVYTVKPNQVGNFNPGI
jgi:hypothetical protein